MKNILSILLLFITGSTLAQTLYTHHGAIPITEDHITFKAEKFRGTIQWQCSSDGLDWINLEDETRDSLNVAVVDAGYYRAEIKDGSCNLVYSDTALISTNSKNETGTFTDRRDGRTYQWVKIGKQVWMAENLAYLPAVSTSGQGSSNESHYYVYGYEGNDVATAKATSGYSKYGVLYNWQAANEACPSGWHLPSEVEWANLANSFGGKSNAGFEMKSIVGWNSSIISATNSSGFSALPGGSREASGGFSNVGHLSGNWWSDPLNQSATEAFGWSLSPNVSNLLSQKTDMSNGFSVRCVKDTVDVLVLTVTVPESVDANAVTLNFPSLKYNKKLAVSWINDDGLSTWNWVYNLVNKKFVSTDSGNFHHGMTSANGYVPNKFLEYTDGAGVKHRFAASVAVFSYLLESMGRDADQPGNIEWTAPNELRIMADFGSTTVYHNLKETYNGATATDKASYDRLLDLNAKVIENMTDRIPKIMAEPDGNHEYINYGKSNDLIQMQTAQFEVVSKVKPFASAMTLDKKDITVERLFYDGSGFVNDRLNQLKTELNGAEANRTWMICSNHVTGPTIEKSFLTQVDSLYGASGNDALWFPSVDEFYEYWYMRKNTTFTKTVKGQEITFKFHLPQVKNFWFKNLSVMLSGISDKSGVTVTSSDNCNGTSYTVSDGKLLVNLDFNADLISKTEKYLDRFKNSLSVFDMEDAQYFIQMLKPGVREVYQAQLNQYISVPTLNGVSINAGADSTTSQAVTVTAPYSGTTTHYIISEDPTFTGASWKPIVSSIPFVLGSVVGYHKVYVKLKNTFGESAVALDSIYFKKVPFSLNSVSINSGDIYTSSTAVDITLDLSGEVPTGYKVSEKPLFGDVASWTEFTSGVVKYTMSSTLGKKTVYVKVKTATEESKVKSDFITLTEPASLTSISLDSGKVSTTSRTVTVDFTYKGMPTHYMLSENNNFSGGIWVAFTTPATYELSSAYGIKKLYARIKDASTISTAAADSIELKMISPAGRKFIFSPVSENSEQGYRTLTNGTVINLCSTKQYEGYENFSLRDVAGVPWASRIVKPSQLPVEMAAAMAVMNFRNPELTGNTGVYPDQYIAKYFGIDGYPELTPAKRGLRFILEPGTYSVKVLFSTSQKETNDGQADIVYEANGIVASPSGIPLNNASQFVKLNKVVVGSDGILDFYASQKTSVFAGFNLLEFTLVKPLNSTLPDAAYLNSVTIESGAESTTSQTVQVDFSYEGQPTHYMLSEKADFSDASWSAFTSPAAFTLSSGLGAKKIYAKIKDANVESDVCSDMIELKMLSPIGRKIIISPVSENYEQKYETLANNTVINLCTTKQWEDYSNFVLQDADGLPWATRIVKPSQLPVEMALNALAHIGFRDPTLSGNKGSYPDIYLAKYFGIDGSELSPAKRGLRLIMEPGTYTLRVLFSTSLPETNNSQADVVYEANGITTSPSGIALNNATAFVELKEVVVGANGILDFYIAQKSNLAAGFNLLEIVKSR